MTVGRAAGYGFGPVTVDVVTDGVELNRWLGEFLAPSIASVPFGRGDAVVRFGSDPDAFEALERRSASATRRTPCFSLDDQVVTLPAWDDEAGVVLADSDLHCFYQVLDHRPGQAPTVDIVGRAGELRARFGLMRVVREILTARRLARGGLLDLHAAAFELGGRAVLIAGGKHAGKTTVLCHALGSNRARAIANDRVFVDVERDGGQVYGIPTLVGIRRDTLALFPGLRGATDGRPVLLCDGEEELERGAVAQGRNVRSLSLSQFAERRGSSVVSAAPLSAVVFPEIVGDITSWKVNELSRVEGLERLARCIHGGRRNRSRPTVFGELGGPAVGQPDPAEIVERLGGTVRFFKCTLGTRAYEQCASEWLCALALDAAVGQIERVGQAGQPGVPS